MKDIYKEIKAYISEIDTLLKFYVLFTLVIGAAYTTSFVIPLLIHFIGTMAFIMYDMGEDK